jgi:hypothetical protein
LSVVFWPLIAPLMGITGVSCKIDGAVAWCLWKVRLGLGVADSVSFASARYHLTLRRSRMVLRI